MGRHADKRWHGKYSFKQHSIENVIKVKSAFDFPCLINSVCGSIYSY